MSTSNAGASGTVGGRQSAGRESTATSSSGFASASGGSKTPQSQTSVNFGRNGNERRSPVSPSRITRLQEKEEMQNLNDRLVIYIDTVRRLESENSRLQSLVYTYNESSTRDVGEIKAMYERELEDSKRLIDELAKEKARFEIEVNKHKANAAEAIAKLEKRDKDFKSLEAKQKSLEAESLEYKSRCELFQTDLGRKDDELSRLRPQVADLEKQLAKLKKQLEDETLLRVDLENKNQSLKEDLQFRSQVYDKEVNQLRSSKRVEIEQVDVRLRDEYDSRLVSELQRIRDETEMKIREMKDEVERRYQNKFADAESGLKRSQMSGSALREELNNYRSKFDESQTELKNMQSRMAAYEAKIRDLEEKLKRASLKYEKDVGDKEAEIVALRKEMQELLLDYQELYDIKIALDMEIAAYRKLLESEEQRLNISTTGLAAGGPSVNMHNSYLNESSLAAGSTTRSGKKRRIANIGEEESASAAATSSAALSPTSATYSQSHESKSGISIAEHDFEGKCVRIVNTSDKEIPIGGWQLRRVADGQETDYKFHKALVIKPGQQINVWSSSCSGVSHEPPSDLVMNGQRWFVGDKMITVLADKDGNEQARRESQRNLIVGVEKKLRATPTRPGSSMTTTEIRTTTTTSSTASANGNGSSVSKLFGLWKS